MFTLKNISSPDRSALRRSVLCLIACIALSCSLIGQETSDNGTDPAAIFLPLLLGGGDSGAGGSASGETENGDNTSTPVLANDLAMTEPVLETAQASVGGTQLRVRVHFAFDEPPAPATTLSAFIGRPGVINLDADGETVHQFVSQTGPVPATDYFQFYWPVADKFQVFIVAKNGSGKSLKLANNPNDQLPVLNDPVIETARSGDDQRVRVDYTLQNPVPAHYTIKAYVGRPHIMNFNNGVVSGAYDSDGLDPFGSFTFFYPDPGAVLKVIVIAQNAQGMAVKQALTVPPPPPPDPCAGAVAAPTTIGDCNQHCVEVSQAGDTMTVRTKYTTQALTDYLWLDLTTSSPSGFPGPTDFRSIELGLEDPPAGIPAGQQILLEEDFDVTNYAPACVAVSSFSLNDDYIGLETRLITVP